jgi:WD40 repeat protein
MFWKAFCLFCLCLLALTLAACLSAEPPQERGNLAPILPVEPEVAGLESAQAESTPTRAAERTTPTPDETGSKKKRTATPMPAGPLVAFVHEGRIWVDAAESGSWPVTAGENDDEPLFSPDGMWLLFRRHLSGSTADLPLWELWLASLDGSQERLVAGEKNLPGFYLHRQLPVNPVWSPGGSAIAFETQPECSSCAPSEDLWVYNMESGAARQILFEEEGGAFAFSPDGSRLAVSSRTELYVLDANGNNRRTLLVYEPIVYLTGFQYPLVTWAPDGQSILAAVPPKDQMQVLMGQATPGVDSRTNLWRLWLNGDADMLAQLPRVNGGAWSPDRSMFAYSEIATARLVIVSVESGQVIYESAGLFQNWNPDSHSFTFLPDLPGKTFWLSEMEMGCIDNNAFLLVPAKEAAGLRPVTWVDETHFVYLAKTGAGIDGDGFEIRYKEVKGSYRLIYASADRWASMAYAVYHP